MISRRELNNFERKVMNAERRAACERAGCRGVVLESREARDLMEYVQWLERAVLLAGEKAARAGDSNLEADLFSVIA